MWGQAGMKVQPSALSPTPVTPPYPSLVLVKAKRFFKRNKDWSALVRERVESIFRLFLSLTVCIRLCL